MAYVEFLRVRRTLIIYSIIVTAIVLIALISYAFSTDHRGIVIDGHSGKGSHHEIPLSFLVLIAAYFSAIVASIVGSYLACEREHLPLAWTKPVSRERFALTYIAVDAAAIIAAFLVTFLFGELFTITAAGFGSAIVVDGDVLTFLLLGFGFAFAFYGVVRVLANLFGRGGMIVGISWPVGFVLAGLAAAPFPYVLHDIIVGLNFLNPLAYSTSLTSGRSGSALPIPLEWRIACEWILAIGTMAASVVIWKRLED